MNDHDETESGDTGLPAANPFAYLSIPTLVGAAWIEPADDPEVSG